VRAPGIFAVSRLDATGGTEVLMAFNTSTQGIDAQIEVDPQSRHFHALHGSCASTASAPGSYRVQVAALDYIICKSGTVP
jgi:hypothetical protein